MKLVLPRSTVRELSKLGQEKFPLETGGVFMGMVPTNGHDEYLITKCIGPGPDATHDTHSFRPDYDFQEAEIARHYAETGRKATYLGDWHTHPYQSKAHLSSKDKMTLRRIAHHKEARIDHPLMAVLHGQPGEWLLSAWQYVPSAWSFILPKVSPLIIVKGE